MTGERICLSREEQGRLIGLLAELRERVNSANLRARMLFRRMDGGVEILDMAEWLEAMQRQLDQIYELLYGKPKAASARQTAGRASCQ